MSKGVGYLVGYEGTDLVEISGDMFNDFKIKSISMPGKVKFQAMTKDETVKYEIGELTIKLYVVNQPYFDAVKKGHGYPVYGLFLSPC